MEEQKELVPHEPQPEESTPPKKDAVRHTWVTDLYDKMNIPVRTLDFMLVFLAVFILAVIIIASQNK